MTMRTRVKICGLTRLEDAELAIRLGADALGFVFWPASPRAVSADAVRAIVRQLPALPVRVGVFVDASPDEIARTVEIAALDVIQLHGNEDVGAYRRLSARFIKSVHLVDEDAIESALRLPSDVVPLVDAIDPKRHGGTGRVADWVSAARLATRRPVLLAGGLTAENVRRAISDVQPWAIDVASGVESAPGIKSADRMRAFFEGVREANVEVR